MKIKNLSFIIIGLLIFLVIGLFIIKGINNQTPTDEGGLVSGIPCGPPCYSGIVPGITKISEVEGLLKKNYHWINCKEVGDNPDSKGLRCDNVFINYDISKSETVMGIGFSPGPKIVVDQLINKYGPPDMVITDSIGVTIHTIGMRLLYNKFRSLILQLELFQIVFSLK